MQLHLLEEDLAVIHLESGAPIPAWVWSSRFYSITRTEDELSIFCQSLVVPPDLPAVGGWRALRVVGTLDFSLVGIISSLTVPLAAKQISVFSISTHDTDYLLVREERLDDAVDILKRAGHEFV